MSSAPAETTCGIARRAAAPWRSGPALSTPPTTSSHHSVVVTSSTPCDEAAVDQRLPSPGRRCRWRGRPARRSRRASSCWRAAVTHGVVTPNIVAASSGRGGRRRGRVVRDRRLVDHAGDGAGGVGEDPARQRVEAGDIDHRRHQRDVVDVDVLRGVAGGQRRDHQLGHADRQRAHRRGDHRRAAAAAEAEDGVEAAVAVQRRDQRAGAAQHGVDGRPAIAGGAQRGEVGAAGAGDLRRRDVRRRRPARRGRRGPSRATSTPRCAQAIADVGVSAPLVSSVPTRRTVGIGDQRRAPGRAATPRAPRRRRRRAPVPRTPPGRGWRGTRGRRRRRCRCRGRRPSGCARSRPGRGRATRGRPIARRGPRRRR